MGPVVVDVDKQGRTVTAGLVQPVGESSWQVIRLLPSGKPDRLLGQQGIVVLPQNQDVKDLRVQADGKVLILGHNRLIRLNQRGYIDYGFGRYGKVVPGGKNDALFSALDLSPDGSIVVAGNAEIRNGSALRYRVGVWRYTPKRRTGLHVRPDRARR